MEKKIMEICSNLICREISPDEQLIATGMLDSFKIMELICSLEEAFAITFLPEEIMELEHFSSVKHMVDIVGFKVRSEVR